MAVTPLRAEGMPEESARFAAPFLLIALRALSERALLWLVTLGAGGIWVYTVLQPETWRIVAALGYSLTVLFPFLWRDRQRGV